ncbi:hypothetical protein [Pseudotamlana carrageenivorans]|uniref:Uncharacterized protein n=1 Tax=Pseudotamlana carrageenivorans TaxID=2069432 RepID=A0A2I7SJT8_9FLAO|nr:hypothetical protein [Tamlana carrageenivorans]AUS06168.1 hypothetical protein C1A40_12215 [Tamlana carrageenivorans]
MRIKLILLGFGLFLVSSISFAQKSDGPKSIISDKVKIKKYHNIEELERMAKGEVLALYRERNTVLTRILPYIAFATKPGVTMVTLGIPTNSANVKALDNQLEAADEYVNSTTFFLNEYLPYADTRNLISGILFYEEIMKSLHTFNEYR